MTEQPTWLDTIAEGAAWLKARQADYAQAATVLQQAPTGSRLIQQPGELSEAQVQQEVEGL
jgi:hypothetical protein